MQLTIPDASIDGVLAPLRDLATKMESCSKAVARRIDAYKNETRGSLQTPDEVWHSSYGAGWLYVRWVEENVQGFITILNDDRTFATAGFRYAKAIFSISYSRVPGARFDECIYPIPAPR